MPRFIKSIPFHPFFFAIYPVLALYAFNMGQSRLSDAVRVFLIIPALAGLVLISVKFLLKDWGRAALLTSFVFLLFFSYGHLVNRLSSSRFGPFLEGVPWLVALVYLIFFLAGVYLIVFRMKVGG